MSVCLIAPSIPICLNSTNTYSSVQHPSTVLSTHTSFLSTYWTTFLCLTLFTWGVSRYKCPLIWIIESKLVGSCKATNTNQPTKTLLCLSKGFLKSVANSLIFLSLLGSPRWTSVFLIDQRTTLMNSSPTLNDTNPSSTDELSPTNGLHKWY